MVRAKAKPGGSDALSAYNAKRDFAKTREPKGRKLKGLGDNKVQIEGIYNLNVTDGTDITASHAQAQALPQRRAVEDGAHRVATFCAEPTSPTVQQFGMQLMTPQYINSYWATEHGGIAWTHFYGNADFPLRADAHTYPLPWIVGDVWLEDAEGTRDGEVLLRRDSVMLRGRGKLALGTSTDSAASAFAPASLS